MKFRRQCILFTVVLCLFAAGCAKSPTPSPPPPPSLTLQQTNLLLADSCRAANATLIQLRNAGKVDAASVRLAQDKILVYTQFSDDLAKLLANGKEWSTQQPEVVALAAKYTPLLAADTSGDPNVSAIINNLAVLVRKVSEQVGGVR